LTHAKNDQYDFFCLLGDTVYANATSKSGYWDYWDYVLQQDGLYDLFSSCSVTPTWDDHEIANNFNWNDFSNAEERFENALWAFRRGLPQREGGDGQIWRKISHGKVLDIFVLDCRGERRGTNYISDEQMSWLKEELEGSDARFKIMMNSVPITDYEALLQSVEEDDRWQGFPEQRIELLSFIEDSGVEGVLWITGDFHMGAISKVGAPEDIGSSMHEVMVGPSGSFLNPIGDLMIETEQYLLGLSQWNHTRFVCNPETGEIIVQFVGDSGDVLEEMSLMI
jgi:alkaline phosphatase D